MDKSVIRMTFCIDHYFNPNYILTSDLQGNDQTAHWSKPKYGTSCSVSCMSLLVSIIVTQTFMKHANIRDGFAGQAPNIVC